MTKLRMRQMVDNGPSRNFSYDAADDKWTLETGGGLRTFSREFATSGNDQVRTAIVTDPVYGEITKTTETFRTFPWSEERVTEVRDPDGRALTTTWDFYDDAVNDGNQYGQLKHRIDPTGYWEHYEYDALGRRTKTVSSWKGSLLTNVATESIHKVRYVAYWDEDLDTDGRREEIQRTVEEIEGQEVSRHYRVEWGETFTEPNPNFQPGEPYQAPYRLKSVSNIRVGAVGGAPDPDDPANLTTTTHTYISGPWEGEPRRVLHPDGTVTLYEYSLDGANLTTRRYHGEPASDDVPVNAIFSGRVTITVVDDGGNILSETEKSFEETHAGLITLSSGGGGGLLPEPPVTMPDFGANAVYVGRDSSGQLQFRIFDREGEMLVDENEANLPDQAGAIANLKTQLNGFWSESALTLVQQRALIAAVKSITGIGEIDGGVVIGKRNVDTSDDFGRPLAVSYPLDGTTETFVYGDFGEVATRIARDGTVATNAVDALGRIYKTEQNGIAHEYSLDANGRRRKTTRIGTDNSIVVVDENHYDPVGELAWSKDAAGETTTYSAALDTPPGLWKRTVTYPDNGQRIELTYPDGTLQEVKGSAVAHREYEYGTTVTGQRWTKEIFVGESGAGAEWVKTYTDMLGRTVRREYPYPSGAEETWEFNNLDQLVRHTDADGVTRRFRYNSLGEMEITATAIDGVSDIAFAGKDRIRRTTRKVLSSGHPENTRGEDIIVTLEEAWTENDVDSPQILSRHETTTSGLRSWQIRGDAVTGTEIDNDFSGSSPIREIRNTQPDGSYTLTKYINGDLQREARYGADDTLLSETTYLYDAHGRLEFSDSLRNGRTTLQYDGADRLWKVTTPSPAAGQPSQTTEYGYDEMGRQNKIVHPDAAETKFAYWPNGKLKKTWSDRTYPVEYTYDPQGRKKTMTTWQEFNQTTATGISGDATTTWNYHPQRGWLESKTYEDDTGPTYTYWPSGRLETRTWERQVDNQPLVTTYTYNEAGDLWTVEYTDDTPDVTHTYDRLGRLKTTTDAAGLLTRGYTDAGALEYEDYTNGGLLDGVSIDRGYDPQHRLRVLQTDGGYAMTTLFDTAGRLDRITESFHHADLGYETGTEILNRIDIHRVATHRLTHERSIDKLGRVEWTKTTVDGQTAVRRDYTYNLANQRTLIEHEDGRAWHYGYDNLGQVNSAVKRLSANPSSAILPGYSYGYAFDDIGNREDATRNNRTATYIPNLLNQYANRDIPGHINVLGEAKATATVTVNNLSTQRTGRDFRKEISVANSSGAVYSAVEVEAEINSQTVDETRHAFIAKDPEVFVHDPDGNLESDGRWTYEWDGENRLEAMETITTVATAFPDLKQRLEFAYDSHGRPIGKTMYEWDSSTSSFILHTSTLFIYDGWLLIEERDALNNDLVLRTHVWGPDLSGSMQGAGGVGGLLWTQTPTQTFAASTDANGNIVAWINTATKAVVGRLDYSPFGEPVVQTGVANELPFGFSTKYRDSETDLLYYGYRYYSPDMGRWLNRDPINEAGHMLVREAEDFNWYEELNLYAMVGNDPINGIDHLGLSGVSPVAFGLCLSQCMLMGDLTHAGATILVLWELANKKGKLNKEDRRARREAQRQLRRIAKKLGTKAGSRFIPGVGWVCIAIDLIGCSSKCYKELSTPSTPPSPPSFTAY